MDIFFYITFKAMKSLLDNFNTHNPSKMNFVFIAGLQPLRSPDPEKNAISLSAHNPHLRNGQCDLLRVTNGILAFLRFFFKPQKKMTQTRVDPSVMDVSSSWICVNIMFLCESMRNHHATNLQKHQSSSGQRLRFVGVFLRTMLEKATACKYSSRSMSKEKKKSSLIDDPTSYRCRRRLQTYGSHFAGFLACYHFPHCHNMTHITNTVYLENHIIRFIWRALLLSFRASQHPTIPSPYGN